MPSTSMRERLNQLLPSDPSHHSKQFFRSLWRKKDRKFVSLTSLSKARPCFWWRRGRADPAICILIFYYYRGEEWRILWFRLDGGYLFTINYNTVEGLLNQCFTLLICYPLVIPKQCYIV